MRPAVSIHCALLPFNFSKQEICLLACWHIFSLCFLLVNPPCVMLPLIALLAHLHQVMGADSPIGLLHVRCRPGRIWTHLEYINLHCALRLAPPAGCKIGPYSSITPWSCDLLAKNQCRTVDLSIFNEFLMYFIL